MARTRRVAPVPASASAEASRPDPTRFVPVESASAQLTWLRRRPEPAREAVATALLRLARERVRRRANSVEVAEAVAVLWAACGKIAFAALKRAHQRLSRELMDEAEEKLCDLIVDVIATTTAKDPPQFYFFAHRRIASLYEEMARGQRSPHRRTEPLFSGQPGVARHGRGELGGEADGEPEARLRPAHLERPGMYAVQSLSSNFIAPAAELLEDRSALESFLLAQIDEAVHTDRHRTILRHWLGLSEFAGNPMASATDLGHAYQLTRQRIDQLTHALFDTVREALGY